MTTKRINKIIDLFINECFLTKKAETQLTFIKSMIPTESDDKAIKEMKLAAIPGMLEALLDSEDTYEESYTEDDMRLKGITEEEMEKTYNKIQNLLST